MQRVAGAARAQRKREGAAGSGCRRPIVPLCALHRACIFHTSVAVGIAFFTSIGALADAVAVADIYALLLR